MNAQDYILSKFGLSFDDKTSMPIEIPDFGRRGLAELFAELDFKVGVEIGVREGEYSEILVKTNPSLKLYGIDPYAKYSGYRDHIESEPFDEYFKTAKKRLANHNYEFVRKFSTEALADFADESLDFVYIDANHDFKNCTDDIANWVKKIRHGGIISGHDYTRHRKPTRIHCYEVVNGYTSAYDIKPWFITSSKVGSGSDATVEARSWFWVNQPVAGPTGSRE